MKSNSYHQDTKDTKMHQGNQGQDFAFLGELGALVVKGFVA